MNLYLKDKNLHHAYCIVGNSRLALLDLYKFLKNELNFNISGNPDFWHGKYDVMDIEDSRTLKELHYNKPVASDKKFFVLQANFITEKAQNAMLKLFEEPIGGTHFFIILPSSSGLIPTLKSRLLIVEHASVNDTKINAKDFLKANIGERMNMVKSLAASISNEEESKIEVVNFFNMLEKEIFSKNKVSPEIFTRLEKARQYANDQSPSLKMLLEYTALIMPTLK